MHLNVYSDVIHALIFHAIVHAIKRYVNKESSRYYKTGSMIMNSAHNIIAKRAPAKEKYCS